jgi:hypothetical protein
MHLVIRTIGFDQTRLKVLADTREEVTQRRMGSFRQDFPTVLGHKDQVDV